MSLVEQWPYAKGSYHYSLVMSEEAARVLCGLLSEWKDGSYESSSATEVHLHDLFLSLRRALDHGPEPSICRCEYAR